MRVAATALLLCAATSVGVARAETVPFDASIQIRASVGQDPVGFELISLHASGNAEIDGGVVRFPAGAVSGPIPTLSGFGGTLANGSATFSASGAGAGSTCPLSFASPQEICIDGGGFGGVMALSGITQEGQALAVWGVGGTGMATVSGVPRTVEGTRWTRGGASAYFLVTELDPVTPFLLSGAGTFRGLPSTYEGPGLPGFSLVTPMVATAQLAGSSKNVRALATLRIDFTPAAVPLGGPGVLAALLLATGVSAARSGARRARSP
jgi:hypothetical protein